MLMAAPIPSQPQATIMPVTTPKGKKSSPINSSVVSLIGWLKSPSPIKKSKRTPMERMLNILAIQQTRAANMYYSLSGESIKRHTCYRSLSSRTWRTTETASRVNWAISSNLPAVIRLALTNQLPPQQWTFG